MGDRSQPPDEDGDEREETADRDEDIAYLLDVQQTVRDIEEGRRQPSDDMELRTHRKMYKERFRDAFLRDEIVSVDVVEEDEHSLKVTTERFEATGKLDADGDRVVYTVVEHPDEDLKHEDVTGEVCKRMLEARNDHVRDD